MRRSQNPQSGKRGPAKTIARWTDGVIRTTRSAVGKSLEQAFCGGKRAQPARRCRKVAAYPDHCCPGHNAASPFGSYLIRPTSWPSGNVLRNSSGPFTVDQEPASSPSESRTQFASCDKARTWETTIQAV